MTIQKVHEIIDNMHNENMNIWKDLVRQPSVSSNHEQVRKCAEMLVEIMESSGIETQIFETEGNPLVYGEIKSEQKDSPTLLFYGHYDVQPPEPLELWDSPPFEPEIRNGRLYGRGTGDNKGQLLTHILAIRAYLKVFGSVPINIKFIFEGDEEIGSYPLEQFAKANKELLSADLVYTSDGAMEAGDIPILSFGVRGVMNFDLILKTATMDNHSGNKGGVIKNAAWEMVKVLSSMKDSEGRVLVEGFYDDLVRPTDYELKLIDNLSYDPVKLASAFGVDNITLEKKEYFTRLMFQPTLTINGLRSGHLGEGSKNIIPGYAVAKMEIRLAYDQNPQKLIECIRNHVKRVNPDVEVVQLESDMLPSKTYAGLPVAQVVSKAVSKVSNKPPLVFPSTGGSLPDYIWTKILGIPSVLVPYANIDEQNHAPNENMKIDLFNRGIHISAQVIHDFINI